MNKDQAIGTVILIASVATLVAYSWLLYAYAIVVLQITAFVAVAAVLVILAWIGGTMATTPPPAPFEPETAATETTAPVSSEEKTSQTDVAKKDQAAQ
jgi:predicted DNA-binding transcriptional regulator